MIGSTGITSGLSLRMKLNTKPQFYNRVQCDYYYFLFSLYVLKNKQLISVY